MKGKEEVNTEAPFSEALAKWQENKILWNPLKAFFEAAPEKEESRGVLLLYPNWEKVPVDTPVGWFLFKKSTTDQSPHWAMWASNFEYTVQKDVNGDLKKYSISGPRLSFSLDDSGSSAHDYFGVPVSSEFVRILQPEHRPAVKSVAPVGYVTTVELSPDHEDEAQVIKPVWEVEDKKNPDGTKVFRLQSAEGYDFPIDWIRQQEQKYQNWRKD